MGPTVRLKHYQLPDPRAKHCRLTRYNYRLLVKYCLPN